MQIFHIVVFFAPLEDVAVKMTWSF